MKLCRRQDVAPPDDDDGVDDDEVDSPVVLLAAGSKMNHFDFVLILFLITAYTRLPR